MLARLKFNIDQLVNEILDQIPQDLIINGRVLDPAIGGGQFVAEVERRKRAAGKTNAEIKNSVFGFESNILRRDFAVNKNKLISNYQVVDFIEEDLTNMKFDVIVGNPPYGKDTKAKRWTLWEEFVKKSMTLADTVAMVVPQSLTSPGNTWGLVKSNCSVINVDVSKHFNVGSTFCYFIATPNQEQLTTKIITSDKEYNIDIRKLPFLPVNINDTTINQIDQLMSRASRKWRRGELHTSNKHLFNDNGKYEVMHTNAQTLHTDVNHANLNKIRVGVTLSGYPTFKVITNGYMSQACFWTEFDNVADAQAFADECNGSDVQELLNNFKWSGWNSKEVIECL